MGCSVPWGVQYRRVFSTMGGYHEYRGGIQYRGDILSTVGVLSTVGDIMSTMGVILKTVGCSVPWGIS